MAKQKLTSNYISSLNSGGFDVSIATLIHLKVTLGLFLF